MTVKQLTADQISKDIERWERSQPIKPASVKPHFDNLLDFAKNVAGLDDQFLAGANPSQLLKTLFELRTCARIVLDKWERDQ